MTRAVDGDVAGRKLSRSSLRDQAVDALRDMVIGGEIPPGGRINEAELAEKMGISRGPLREAIQRIGAEGLIDFRSRGAFVREISREDVRLIYEVRIAVESAAARRVARVATASAIADLERQVTQLDDVIASLDEQPEEAERDVLELTNEFHLTILRLSENSYLERYGSDLHVQLRVARLHSGHSSTRAKQVLKEHRAILKAIAKRDENAAGQAMGDHLRDSLARFEAEIVKDIT